MAQQINLCTSAFRPVRQRFTAKILLQIFGIFLVIGIAVTLTLLQGLQKSRLAFEQSIASRAREVESLTAAIALSRAKAAPADSALVQQLQEKQAAVARTEKVLAAARQGVFLPGEGQSDWLQMVARSIPASMWLVSLKLDAGKFEVSGFTLETAALNEWVGKLRNQPLMQTFDLHTVSVDQVPGALRPTWAFSLISAAPVLTMPAPGAASAQIAGAVP
jgi:Tfp pilus assembly protein PilN